ncbi:hypothetical protein BH11PSE11_BH11PSE11_24860 [soil metagenome]
MRGKQSRDRCDLLESMNSSIDLDTLLDLLGDEIQSLGLADGFLVKLRDANSNHLVSMKIQFTPEFKSVEEIFLHSKVPLKGDGQDTSARSFNQRCILHVNHDNGSDEEKDILRHWKLQEITAIPMLENANIFDPPNGSLVILKQNEKLTEDAVGTLTGLVSLFYKPLRNALEYSFLKEFQDRFEGVAAEHARFLQFIVEMNNLTSHQKILDMFVVEAFRQLKFDVTGIFLLENDLLASETVAARESGNAEIVNQWREHLAREPYLLNLMDGGVSHAFMNNSKLLFPDVRKVMHLPMSPKDKRALEILKSVRTLLMIPIRYQNQPIGVIIFLSLGETLPVSESDLHLLENLSSFLGTAIINSRNYEVSQAQNREIERLNLILQDKVIELGEQAATDRLTGLFNFRTFEHELGRRINEFERNSDKEGLSIAVIDIDHFKNFNDKHGHSAGNVVLAGVAQEISKLVRKMDLACRYGGEEFVVILSKCDLDGIKTFSERLRAAIQNAAFETDAGKLSVTVSIGCTTHLPNDTNESIFKRADQALYRAKGSGRNRIEAA